MWAMVAALLLEQQRGLLEQQRLLRLRRRENVMNTRDVVDFMNVAQERMNVPKMVDFMDEEEKRMIGPTVVVLNGDSALGQVLTKALCAHNMATETQSNQAQDSKVPWRDEYAEVTTGRLSGTRLAKQANERSYPPPSTGPRKTVGAALDTTEELIDALMNRRNALEGSLSSVLETVPEAPSNPFPSNGGMVGRIETLNSRLRILLESLTMLENRLEI